MGCPGHVTWATGLDGVLAAVLRRAALDLEATWDITPAEARRLAKKKSSTLPVDCCKLALRLGFRSPAQDLASFFESERLERLLGLCGVNAGEIVERVGYRG
jgi:hypothetical protein